MYILKAKCHAQLGQHSECIKTCSEGLNLCEGSDGTITHQNLLELYMIRSESFAATSQHDKALKDLSECRKLVPEDDAELLAEFSNAEARVTAKMRGEGSSSSQKVC
jgi:tetratricopeptide (TPR) repeat protein